VQHTLLSATVIANDATTADAYATYFMVVGLDRAKQILCATPDMEALLIYGEQENMKQYCTPGLAKMIRR
jgi:thiamine biosynthesis lipoprotein